MREPKCDHVRTGIVTSGDPKRGPHAATNVCSRMSCIYDAQAWASAVTGQEAEYVPDGAS